MPIGMMVDAAEAVPESTLTPRRTAAAAATRARLRRPNRPALRDMGPPDATPDPGATRPGGPRLCADRASRKVHSSRLVGKGVSRSSIVAGAARPLPGHVT